jgi:O-antigen/teichoic acid export membrane protein
MAEGEPAYFEDHSARSDDLGRRALRGGIVSIGMQYGNGVLQIAAAIALARILAPEDFGLVAIVTVVTSFAPALIDFGLADAITQRSRITQGQVSSLFWFSVGLGLATAVVLAAFSPLIAAIYREPRLEPIALCMGASFVLWGTSNLHLALLRRSMRFGTIARIQMSSTFIGAAVAISLALCGFGYWALVLRPVAHAASQSLGAWLLCRWRPGRPAFGDDVRSILRFGLHVVGFWITATLARAVDRIGLGLFYRPEVVGYYQNATALFEYSISLALGQVQTVGSASLSKLQSDPVALRQKYEAALSALAFFVMPMAAILSVTAEDLTALLLGEKWRPAGVLLSIIALRGIFQVVEASQGWLNISIGRADRLRNWGIVSLGAQIAGVLAGLSFGPKGVAAASVIATALVAIPAINYAGRPIGVGADLVIRAVSPQFIGAVSCLAAGWYLHVAILGAYPGFMRILISGALCSCVYLLIVAGLFRLTEPIKVAGSIVQDLLGPR